MSASLTSPAPLNSEHDVENFQSDAPELDEWLQRRALHNERSNASRTYVVCDGVQVVGFYSLASGAIDRTIAPKAITRNMPNPVPVLVLGRLAVDRRFQGTGIGGGLLRDAIARALRVSDEIGIKAILVHARSEDAKRFYLRFGFVESPHEPMTLCLALSNIA